MRIEPKKELIRVEDKVDMIEDIDEDRIEDRIKIELKI